MADTPDSVNRALYLDDWKAVESYRTMAAENPGMTWPNSDILALVEIIDDLVEEAWMNDNDANRFHLALLDIRRIALAASTAPPGTPPRHEEPKP